MELLKPSPSAPTADLNQQYKSSQIAIIRNFISDEAVQVLIDHFNQNSSLHVRGPDLPGISRKCAGNLPAFRMLHTASTELVNSIVGVNELCKPSYSLASKYDAKSTLPSHTDRSQCVFNISLALEQEGAQLPWPFFIKAVDSVHQIFLNPGDAVLYRGTEHPHWREEMPAETTSMLGAFFHYVPIAFTGSLD